jgi:hypothetical protein
MTDTSRLEALLARRLRGERPPELAGHVPLYTLRDPAAARRWESHVPAEELACERCGSDIREPHCMGLEVAPLAAAERRPCELCQCAAGIPPGQAATGVNALRVPMLYVPEPEPRLSWMQDPTQGTRWYQGLTRDAVEHYRCGTIAVCAGCSARAEAWAAENPGKALPVWVVDSHGRETPTPFLAHMGLLGQILGIPEPADGGGGPVAMAAGNAGAPGGGAAGGP